MASQNIARLGVVLGLDSAEFQAGIDKAVAANKKMGQLIKADSNAAAREILSLKYATDNYNKSLTKTEEIQYAITQGKFVGATKEAKDRLLEQAKAYDAVAASATKANLAQMGGAGGKLPPHLQAALDTTGWSVARSVWWICTFI